MANTKGNEPSTIGMAELEPIRWLPDQCQLSDKVTALFEPRHARRYGRISFQIGRSMGGWFGSYFQVTTLKFSVHCPLDTKTM